MLRPPPTLARSSTSGPPRPRVLSARANGGDVMGPPPLATASKPPQVAVVGHLRLPLFNEAVRARHPAAPPPSSVFSCMQWQRNPTRAPLDWLTTSGRYETPPPSSTHRSAMRYHPNAPPEHFARALRPSAPPQPSTHSSAELRSTPDQSEPAPSPPPDLRNRGAISYGPPPPSAGGLASLISLVIADPLPDTELPSDDCWTVVVYDLRGVEVSKSIGNVLGAHHPKV